MSRRPFFRKTIDELEEIVQKGWNSQETLAQVLAELTFRKQTWRVRRLRDQIKTRFPRLNASSGEPPAQAARPTQSAAQIARPFFHKGIGELEEIAGKEWHSPQTLTRVLDELNFRKPTWRVRRLRNRIVTHLHELTKARLKRLGADIRGSGTERQATASPVSGVCPPATRSTALITPAQISDSHVKSEPWRTYYLMRTRVENAFGVGNLFAGRVVGVTGSGPYEEKLIAALVWWQMGIVGDRDIWQSNQLIVIGRRAFDQDYLRCAAQHVVSKKFTFYPLSQEDFVVFFDRGIYPNYQRNDERVLKHEGLRFLASIGFRWPSIVAPSHPTNRYYDYRYLGDHPLSVTYGYNVKRDTSVEERRAALRRAIKPRPIGLGLQEVVEHIAWLVRDRKRCWRPEIAGAIARWEEDLAWLKRNYYDGTEPGFIWPEY